MRAVHLADLLSLAFAPLWEHKVRTVLSLVGVSIGSFSLALSLSVSRGVEDAFIRQLRENDELRKIYVSASFEGDSALVPRDTLMVWGIMSEARRARLHDAIVSRWNREHYARPKAVLTADRLVSLGAIPHVRRVIPAFEEKGRAVLDGQVRPAAIATFDAGEEGLQRRLVAGRFYQSASDREAVVHEYLVYSWGIVNEADVRSVIGRKMRVEYSGGRSTRYPVLSALTGGKVRPDAPDHEVLERLVSRTWPLLEQAGLPENEQRVATTVLQALTPPDNPYQDKPITEDFTIVGVIRGATKGDRSGAVAASWMTRQADVLIPYASGQEFMFRASWNADRGADAATLQVDDEQNVGAVAAEVRRRGYYEYSLEKVIDHFRLNVLMITLALAFIAAVALIVSAIGIANTMLIGVLQRVREIGVMKAVGARDWHVQLIFLLEGATLGLVGGGIGVLLSWLTQFPGNSIARTIIEQQTKSPPTASVFVYPFYVVVGVPLLSCAIATLAAVVPSRRAARVDPVVSLRRD